MGHGVILFRELGITLMRFWVIRHGVIPASRGGKMKTLAQGTAVGMYVLALTGPLATLRFWVMAVAVVLTVVTGLDYVRQAVVLRRQGLRADKAAAVQEAAEHAEAALESAKDEGRATGKASRSVSHGTSHGASRGAETAGAASEGTGDAERVSGSRGAAEAER